MHRWTTWVARCVAFTFVACGDSGGATDSASANATSTTAATAGTSTGSVPTTSDGDGTTAGHDGSASATTSATAEPTTDTSVATSNTSSETAGTSTGEPLTASTTDTTAADTTVSTIDPDTGTTGGPGCEIADIDDTLAFTYSKSIDLAPINTIQASFYNQDAQEIVFFSYFGQGRRYSLDGTPLGDVMAPPEALPNLDGASFDQVNRVGMLITQECAVVDVDPVTIETLAVIQLDEPKHGINLCAGVAIGVDGNMYVTSFYTDEIVVMTRDGQTVVDRIDLGALGLPRPDGVSLIAGSENFLTLSSPMILSGIITPGGDVLVGPAPTGQDMPPMIGGGITNPDAVLTVCGNGHAWLCDEYGTMCHDYVPMGGDKDACACTIPQ